MSGHIKRRQSPLTDKITYQARIPSPANGRKDVVKTFKLRKDAERWLTEQASAMHRGDFIDPSTTNQPFSSLVETWRRVRLARLAPKTQERYEGILRVYLLPAFGSMPLSRLKRPMIKEYFATLPASPATARKVHTTLSSILSEGVELELLRENPAARLKLATPPRKTMTILTAAEVRALAEAIPHPTDALAVWTAAYTGLRASELWALQRKHIDLDAVPPRLTVEGTLTSQSGKLVFRDSTKTPGSRRVVTLPDFLANKLAKHSADYGPEALIFTSHGGGNGRKDGHGGPIHHNNFYKRVFRPAVAEALPPEKQDLTWHDLRHTSVNLARLSGASIVLVSKRLGHASITTTIDLYGWLYPSEEAAVATALDTVYDDDNVVPLRRAG